MLWSHIGAAAFFCANLCENVKTTVIYAPACGFAPTTERLQMLNNVTKMGDVTNI